MSVSSEFSACLDLVSRLILDPRTGILIGLLVAAAIFDARTRRIPNLLVFAGTLIALTVNSLAGGPASIGFFGALLGLSVAFAVMLPFYLLRAMGAGDVKLMTMAGAFLGLPQAIWALLATFLAGGLLSLAWLLWRGALRQALFNIVGVLQGFVGAAAARSRPSLAMPAQASAGSLPYGIAIASGTIGYLLLRQLDFIA